MAERKVFSSIIRSSIANLDSGVGADMPRTGLAKYSFPISPEAQIIDAVVKPSVAPFMSDSFKVSSALETDV